MKTVYNTKTGESITLNAVDANERLACGLATAGPNVNTQKTAATEADEAAVVAAKAVKTEADAAAAKVVKTAADAAAAAVTTAAANTVAPATAVAVEAAAAASSVESAAAIAPAAVDCFKGMSIPKIKGELVHRGVGFPKDALKRDLADLLNDARKVQAAE